MAEREEQPKDNNPQKSSFAIDCEEIVALEKEMYREADKNGLLDVLTERDITALAAQTPAKLVRGYLTLNSWKWPKWLPNRMSLEDRQKPGLNRASAAMRWIEKRVGKRVISRAHNSHMTDDEHEDFWRGMHEGDAAAFARYEERLDRLVEEDIARERAFEKQQKLRAPRKRRR